MSKYTQTSIARRFDGTATSPRFDKFGRRNGSKALRRSFKLLPERISTEYIQVGGKVGKISVRMSVGQIINSRRELVRQGIISNRLRNR